MDIYDCVSESLRRYGARIDAANLNIWGYSGGGGNALSAAVRFPDLFSTVTAFFPMTDYAFWHDDSAAYREKIAGRVGGAPADRPGRYAARNAVLAAGNNARSAVHIFWDSEESVCSPRMDWAFVNAAHACGCYNVSPHESRPGDAERWRHGYPHDWPQLAAVEERFFGEILRGGRDVSLPESGHLVVPGFVVTKRFSVFVGDGAEGAAGVEYDLGEEPTFRLRPVAGAIAGGVRVEMHRSR